MRSTVALLALRVCAVLAVGCTDRPSSTPVDGGDEPRPGPVSDQLDVLFVIQNSNNSAANLSFRITPLLDSLTDAIPWVSVHVGIVTSDLGAGPSTPPSCDTPLGDRGILRNEKQGATCATAHLDNRFARFLSFNGTPDGGVGEPNFVGTVDDAFDCYRAVGVGGCGFEHLLGSMRAAIDGCASAGGCTQSANEGFVREAAYLAVIILADEDDCSAAPDATLFDTSQTSVASTLGPLSSYRCFEFGVLCDGVDVGRSTGTRSNCVPGDKDPDPKHQLTHVEEFAQALKALKPLSPRMAYAAVFAGPPSPVEVGLDANGGPNLKASCTGAMRGVADPGIRLARFTSLFDPDRSRFYDICNAPTDEAFAEVGRDLAAALHGDVGGADVRGRDAGIAPVDGGVPDTTPAGATALAVNETNPWAIAVDDDHVYWVAHSGYPGYDAVRRVPRTGGAVENVATGLGCSITLALDAERVYVTDSCAGTVLAVSKRQPGTPVTLLSGLTGPRGLAVDGEAVYAGDNPLGGNGAVRRAALDGTPLPPLGSGLDPQRVIVDATSVYVGNCTSAHAILAYDKASGAERLVASVQSCVTELLVDDTSLYFIGGNGVTGVLGRVSTAGGDPTLYPSELVDEGLAIDDTYAYWYEHQGLGSIRRAPKAGGPVEDLVTNHYGNCVRALAVDATHVYWPNNCDGAIYSFQKP